MDQYLESICRGCLCIGRKMKPLEELSKKQFFNKIIDEVLSVSESILLCWECEALLNRFHKFKTQAKLSYEVLKKCTEKWRLVYLDLRYTDSQLPTNTVLTLERPYNNVPIKYPIAGKPISEIHKPPKLAMHKLFSISANLIDVLKDDMVIKIENYECEPEAQIKAESDNVSVHSDHISEDDKTLIELSREKRVGKRNKKKKKRKQEIYVERELSKKQVEEERKRLELREDYVNAMFRCEKCIISFPNGDDLEDHVNLKHKQNASKFKCGVCDCTFGSEVSFTYHTNKHVRRYECTDCGERFPTKRSAGKHYEATHRLNVEIEYDSRKDIQANGNLHQKEQPEEGTKQETPSFPCHLCEKTFRWKTSLRKHVETHSIETGQKRKPYCEPCRLSFTTTSNLQKHVKTSSNHQIQLKLRKLKENLTEEAANPENQLALKEQIKNSILSSRKQYQCMQCDKRFQWRGNLLRHLESHTARANGELVCRPCNRTFSSIATYKQHMKISKKHVSENDFEYMCSDCGKRFANKTRLKDHVDWEHLKNYVHKCAICQKVFKSHTSLYLHKQVVHKKDSAEHLCDHCGKSFPNHTKLRSHITALHTGESPFRCGACGARFSWHSCLSRHVRRVHRPLAAHTHTHAHTHAHAHAHAHRRRPADGGADSERDDSLTQC